MRNKTKKVLLGAATIAAVGAVSIPGANAATANIAITAKILAPVAIVQVQAMNFGTATEAGIGTIDMETDGVRTASANITLIGAGNTAGQFKITAANNVAFTVTAPAKATITETVGGAVTMTVNAFVLGTVADATGAASPFTGKHIVALQTQDTFAIGGTLNIGAGQLAGTYTGSVKLTANYQ